MGYYKLKKKLILTDESGIASMVVVMLIMTLLTLVVIGMTQNSNRQQRQSLDRQLNSQAFYAAESGVNDARDYIAQNPSEAPIKKGSCDPVNGAGPGQQFKDKSQNIPSTDPSITNVSYSCVLYNRTPTSIEFASVPVGSSKTVPIEDAGGELIQSLTFTWTRENGGSRFNGCDITGNIDLPDQMPGECEAGVLRSELFDADSNSRQTLIDSSFLSFFKPASDSGSSIGYGEASGSVNSQGAIINGGCTNAEGCKVTITGISKKVLYLHLRSLYISNKVSITGTTASGGEVEFRNAQVEVDSTGKVGDILKRIRVRIPYSIDGGLLPEFALQTTDDICKQLQVRPALNEVDDGC